MNVTKPKNCPVCGSDNVKLWNSRKLTFHCHDCDSYFNKYGTVISDGLSSLCYGGYGGQWNGYTDPNDFPTEGFGSGGW